MEFEDVSAQERETRRVAAAFGVTKWQWLASRKASEFAHESEREGWEEVSEERNGEFVRWNHTKGMTNTLQVGLGTDSCYTHFANRRCWASVVSTHNERMARGLYCLGIEDKGVLRELNHSLTNHEKLELRLSMPREFWPKTWIEEEENAAKSP